MSRGVNKVILVGNIGKDPEIRSMPNGPDVTTFSLATSESWTDKAGQVGERTEWHNITMFDKLAGIAARFLKKGSKVYIEGKLRTRKWTDQQGVERYTTEVVAKEMEMLDSKKVVEQEETLYEKYGEADVSY